MTKVKFLLEKVGGGVFAYFPELKFDSSGNMTSYSHIGQHSACHPDYANSCKEANESQYKDLLKELEGQGYDDLIVINIKESRSKFVICPDIMKRDKGRGF